MGYTLSYSFIMFHLSVCTQNVVFCLCSKRFVAPFVREHGDSQDDRKAFLSPCWCFGTHTARRFAFGQNKHRQNMICFAKLELFNTTATRFQHVHKTSESGPCDVRQILLTKRNAATILR